jgi:hypothetical protein
MALLVDGKVQADLYLTEDEEKELNRPKSEVVTVNKRTHKIVMRKEDETENEVKIRIEPKEK